MRRVMIASRYVILLAVVAALLAAMSALIFGALATMRVVFDLAVSGHALSGDIPSVLHGVKIAAVAFIELIDLILLGTVLYIVALGLYLLFIDPTLEVPEGLIVRDIDDLKQRLLGVIIVLLGVNFLSDVTDWHSTPNFLGYGLAIAGVVLAFGIYIFANHWAHQRSHTDQHRSNDQESLHP